VLYSERAKNEVKAQEKERVKEQEREGACVHESRRTNEQESTSKNTNKITHFEFVVVHAGII